MTNEEIKTKEALQYLGFKVDKEVTSKELYYAYLGLSNIYDPNKTDNPKYMDGEAFRLLNEHYNYVSSDICRTNETIRNILNPQNKTYEYQAEKPHQGIPAHENEANSAPAQNYYKEVVVIKDKPSILNIILAFLVPLYGILNYFLVKRFMPKASKWYLIFGILGFIANILIMFI